MEHSYCLLLSIVRIESEAKQRFKTMCSTTDGFLIVEKDLALSRPGDIDGTRQSGALNFKLANIINDKVALELAKEAAFLLCDKDPNLQSTENEPLRAYLIAQKAKIGWGKIA